MFPIFSLPGSVSFKKHSAVLPASFTVEASLLLPPVLLTLLAVLYLCAHIHNRSALTSYACVQAVTGNEQEVSILFLEDHFEMQAVDGQRKRTVSHTLHTVPLLFDRTWEDAAELVYEKPETVRILQIASAARKMMPHPSE